MDIGTGEDSTGESEPEALSWQVEVWATLFLGILVAAGCWFIAELQTEPLFSALAAKPRGEPTDHELYLKRIWRLESLGALFTSLWLSAWFLQSKGRTLAVLGVPVLVFAVAPFLHYLVLS